MNSPALRQSFAGGPLCVFSRLFPLVTEGAGRSNTAEAKKKWDEGENAAFRVQILRGPNDGWERLFKELIAWEDRA